MTLNELKPNDRARILEIGGDEEAADRLMEMGILEDTEVKVVRFAPLGDPIEISVRGYNLSIRKIEAAQITVEKL